MEYIIKDKIDELISKGIVAFGTEKDETTKEAIRVKLELHRAIKTEFKKIEGRTGKEITPEEELKILVDMKSKREEAWNIYKDAGRWDLANKENMETEILSHIIPAMPTEDDIKNYTEEVIQQQFGGKCTMKDMKVILGEVKKKYPFANGGVVSQVVKLHV